MPVAAVEIEVSLQAYEQQTKDGRHWHSFHLSSAGKLMDSWLSDRDL
jgi:hypothetical protein